WSASPTSGPVLKSMRSCHGITTPERPCLPAYSANLGAFEALLIIIQNGEHGLPVYQAVANVRTPFSGPAGIINRLKTLRRLGLLDEKPGAKKSQVCLIPSEKLMRDIYPVLAARHYGGLQE
ncbi:hypothetical protein, partial [Phaeovulum veldkampii]|uniref:hypothetical protein n=2 Tax=Phaeovulum veldkampii TaxID=33049 RepID=UPI001B3B9951